MASGTAASLLAYSLVMNRQTDWPRLLIDNYARNQIADLTLGLIQLSGGQKAAAIESLRSAVARDPGSLAGEQAKQILAREGEQYMPPADPGVVLTMLKDSFGASVVPAFISPSEIISVQLNLRGTEFSYDSNPEGTVVIRNNSSGPLVISEDSLFRGEVRIDARIGGDIEQEIPNLVSRRIRPSSPVAAGESISVDVMLSSGPLGRILSAHPQASLDLEFTVFLDPLITGEGSAANRLSDIEPAKVLIKRPGVSITTKYLQNRLDSISKGRQGQKIKSAQLFAGLLMEQRASAGREPAYNLRYAEWMPDMLKSALVQVLADDDWVVRVYTMAGMLSLPLDYELVSAVSQNLHDTHWPCRLTAVLLLAKWGGDNFDQVLDWTAQYDSNELVREMAIALGGKEVQRKQPPQPGRPTGEKAGVETP
jgi:hypothetical protein